MKKLSFAPQNILGYLLVGGFTLIVIGLIAALLSSRDPQVKSSDRFTIDGISDIHVVHFQGHEYLAFEIQSAGSLCHSESCPCKIK